MSFIQKAGIPQNAVILWGGQEADIPKAYSKCNGLKNTPDMTLQNMVDDDGNPLLWVMKNIWAPLPYDFLDYLDHGYGDYDNTLMSFYTYNPPERTGFHINQTLPASKSSSIHYFELDVGLGGSFGFGIAPPASSFTNLQSTVGAFGVVWKTGGQVYYNGVLLTTMNVCDINTQRVTFKLNAATGELRIRYDDGLRDPNDTFSFFIDTDQNYNPIGIVDAGGILDGRYFMRSAEWLHGSGFEEWQAL